MNTDENNETRRDDDDRERDDGPRGALTTGNVRSNQTVRQGFSESSLAMGNAQTDALVAASRAQTEARWIMAMRHPRNLHDVRNLILGECKRPGFADVATYSRPVGKEQNDKGEWVDVFADGLSIRFAEVAMRCMGNMQCKATVLYDDDRARMITVFAVDYETNATWDIDITVPKTVERKKLKRGQKPIGERVNSYGDRVYIVVASDQEVATKAAAEISKASRTAILRLVPGEIQDEAFDLCRQIAADKQAKDPKATLKRMLDAFAELGVRPSEIEQWLGHRIETGSREEFLLLSRIISSIRENELTWPDALAERLAELAEATKRSTAPAAPAAAPPADPASTGATTPARSAPAAPAPSGGGSSSSGKGTEALKAAVRRGAPAATAPRAPAVDLPPGTPPPAAGQEYRGCSKCGVVIEVPIADPPGGKCYACSAGERDE